MTGAVRGGTCHPCYQELLFTVISQSTHQPQKQPVNHTAGRWRQPWYFESSKRGDQRGNFGGWVRFYYRGRQEKDVTRKEERIWVSIRPTVSLWTMELLDKYYLSWIERSVSVWTKAKRELKFRLRMYVCKERIRRQENFVQIRLTLDWPSCPRILRMSWQECCLKQEDDGS